MGHNWCTVKTESQYFELIATLRSIFEVHSESKVAIQPQSSNNYISNYWIGHRDSSSRVKMSVDMFSSANMKVEDWTKKLQFEG